MSTNRLIHWFTLPKDLHAVAPQHAGIPMVKFGVVELLLQEEMTSAKMSDNSALALGTRQVQMAVRYARSEDGKVQQELSLADESSESFWAKLNPKVRALLLQAHLKVNSPTGSETEGFLKSCESSVG